MSSPAEWIRAVQAQCCPACGKRPMLAGPRGGASQNFYCEACGQGWNALGGTLGLAAVFKVEALGPTDPQTIELYKEMAGHRDTMRGMGLSERDIQETIDLMLMGDPRPLSTILQDREEEAGSG